MSEASRRWPVLQPDASRVLVQGVTGREASYWTERMRRYGTVVVAGVTPGREGRIVDDVPVYDSVETACARHAIDTAVLFVPPRAARTAALDAIRAGISHVVLLAEHVPVHDVMELLAEADERGVRVIGPNSPGIVVPGSHFVGIMPAWLDDIFRPGVVGVVSRSGSLGTLICLELARGGLGQSAFVGVGGDPIVGTTFRAALEMFDGDPQTRVVALIGEVGGTMEEEAADLIARMTTPVIAFVAGRTVPVGRRMGHAGALVSASRGGAEAKITMLRRAGAHVADVPSGVSQIARDLLAVRGESPASHRDR